MRRAWRSWVAALTLVAGVAVPAAPVERQERGNLIIEGIPDIPQDVVDRMRRYRNTRAASLQGWHPSGAGILVSTRFGETSQIHWVREPGGARRQLTFFDEPVSGAEVRPGRETAGFLFRKDVGGSEAYQLYFYDLDDGSYDLLTDGRSRNQGAVWSNDGKRFVYSTTRRNGTDWDVYMADVTASGDAAPVVQEGGVWGAADWSPDDTRILVVRYVSANETHPYILDVETRKVTPFLPTRDKVYYGQTAWAKDGKGVYFTSDQDSEFRRLRYCDLASGKVTVMTADIPWDVEEFDLSADGDYLAFVVNEEGISRLVVRRLKTGTDLTLPEVPVGEIFGLKFEPRGDRLGLVLSTPRSPGDVYTLDPDSGRLVRWTYSEVGGLDDDSFVVPELIRYPTFDSVGGKPRTIPAFYYRPRGPGPFPVLIDIHGGPESQERPFFNPAIQYAVNDLGMAVLAPNVRGSAGYGKSYLELDNGYKREDSVRDIGKLLDWIATRRELDAGRVAVIGGSYGGYMVLASMVHYGDRLRAGIDIVGISSFVTFLENTQPYRRDLRRVEYGDERDPRMREFLAGISPLTHADKIKTPMLVAQGLNDPRVPVGESEQIVRTVRAGGGEVWYVLANDEGHGYRKKSNRDYLSAAESLFLERFVLGPAGAGAKASGAAGGS